MSYKPHKLLLDRIDLLLDPDGSLPVLDLACGEGQNGLVLAERGTPVVFADRSATALEEIKQRLQDEQLPGRTWQIDLEQPGINPLSGQSFSAIICFRYLHRPLFPAILHAVMPGGLVVYETFTIGNRRFGRPRSGEFLLQPKELENTFQGWEILHSFEGTLAEPDRCISQVVVRKPRAPVFPG